MSKQGIMIEWINNKAINSKSANSIIKNMLGLNNNILFTLLT